MTTRVVFNYEDCFVFDEAFTTFQAPDPALVTRITNDFVRFARHLNAMVIEHPPWREQPEHVPITRFVAISPGVRLETSYLPTLADTTTYLREALNPFQAADATHYEPGDQPPPGHYSIRLEDEVRLSILDLRADLAALREHVFGEPPATPTLAVSRKKKATKKKTTKKKTTKKKKTSKKKKARKKRSPYAPD